MGRQCAGGPVHLSVTSQCLDGGPSTTPHPLSNRSLWNRPFCHTLPRGPANPAFWWFSPDCPPTLSSQIHRNYSQGCRLLSSTWSPCLCGLLHPPPYRLLFPPGPRGSRARPLPPETVEADGALSSELGALGVELGAQSATSSTRGENPRRWAPAPLPLRLAVPRPGWSAVSSKGWSLGAQCPLRDPFAHPGVRASA